MSLTFPFDAKLKDGSPVQLVLADNQDIEPLRSLYRMIVEEGTSYPHDRFPDQDDFMDYWFRGKSTVAAYVPDRAGASGMAGAFYLKPNWPGRARQVANAGFIVVPDWRNKGIARNIYDGSSRNRAGATRDRRAEPRGREAYLKQYADRPNGEPACLDAGPTASRLAAAANPRLQQKRS
jgi:GNAT superfamily N-acetyltransferase